MRVALVFVMALGLAACATVEQSSRVQSTLAAREFNSIASRYMDRPTFVTVQKMSDQSATLRVRMSLYGAKESSLPFLKGKSADYAERIDKFLEWEAIAKSRGDALTKEIGRASTWSNGPASGALKFTFHSGNATSHFLAIAFCAAGTCLDADAIYLDASAARELRRLLIAFDADRLGTQAADGIYK